MQTTYIDHLPIGYKDRAVRLYLEALGTKLLPILGVAGRARRVLARDISHRHCFAAFSNRTLVGVLGLQTRDKSFWNPTMKSLMDEYGLMGGLHRMGGLCLLHHETEPGEWCVDGIAVAEEMRGKGVGTGLLRFLEKNAAARGVRTITLEASDVNTRAVALYKRLGFGETGRQSLWPFNHIFKLPFSSAIQMMKRIPEPGAPESRLFRHPITTEYRQGRLARSELTRSE